MEGAGLAEGLRSTCEFNGLARRAPSATARAVELLRRVAETLQADTEVHTVSGLERYRHTWYACAFFVGKAAASSLNSYSPTSRGPRSSHLVSGPCCDERLPLSSLLKTLGVATKDFFMEMKHFVERIKPALRGSASEVLGGLATEDLRTVLRMRELTSVYMCTSVLASKFHKYFTRFFQMPIECEEEKQFNNVVVQFGWIVFLLAKQRLLGAAEAAGVVASIDVLVCSLNLLLAHASPSMLRAPFCAKETIEWPVRTSSGGVDTLSSLCSICGLDTRPEELMPMMRQMDLLLQGLLQGVLTEHEYIASPSSTEVGPGNGFFSCGVFSGLFAKSVSLKRAGDALSTAYEERYLVVGELDERPFVNTAETAAVPTHNNANGSASAAALGNRHRANPQSGTNASRAGLPPSSPHSRPPISGGSMSSPGVSLLRSPCGTLPRPLPKQTRSTLSNSGGTVSAQVAAGGIQGLWSPSASPMRPRVHGSPSLMGIVHLSPGYISRVRGVEGTPVSNSLKGAMWLRGMSARNQSQPSETLLKFFAASSWPPERAEQLKEVVHRLVGRVFTDMPAAYVERAGAASPHVGGRGALPASTNAPASAEVVQRRQQAVRLYYSVLESQLSSETKRKGHSNFNKLLLNESYHRALLACACEVVQGVVCDTRLNFPEIPKRLNICTFEMIKVIESFVFHEAHLPKELKRHLSEIEWRSLEFFAWAPKSTFYNYMARARPFSAPSPAAPTTASPAARPPSTLDGSSNDVPESGADGSAPSDERKSSPPSGSGQGSLPTEEQPNTNTDSTVNPGMLSPRTHRSAFSAFPGRGGGSLSGSGSDSPRTTPPRETPGERMHRPRCFGLPGSVVPGANPVAEQVLHMFFEKVVKLAQIKVRELCDVLKLSTIVAQVNEVVAHTVYKHTHMLYNRHLDQVLLCAVYGVCKVLKIAMSFRDIISQYKKLNEMTLHQTVVRTVVLEQSEELEAMSHGDIIQFYNQAFMPPLKKILVQLNRQIEKHEVAPQSPTKADAIGITPPLAAQRSPGVSFRKEENVYVQRLKNKNELTTSMNRTGPSMFAYLHQETAGFRSPSKDLQAINHMVRTRAPVSATASPVARAITQTPPRIPPFASPGPGCEEPFAKRVRSH
mmetsp:Transcript_28732/g.55055  ORF Transcript_28732/g.55055 Transcript_28732/m.55055 type:complete len:1129 (+) Transcript_28732:326-3712(+)